MKLKDIFATLTSNRLVVLGIKYIPVCATILLTLHVGLLLLGVFDPVTIVLSALLLSVLMLLLSIRFGFCALHKATVVYMILMTLCIGLQKLNVFGCTLIFFRIAMLIFGAVLIALLVNKLVRESDGKCK